MRAWAREGDRLALPGARERPREGPWTTPYGRLTPDVVM